MYRYQITKDQALRKKFIMIHIKTQLLAMVVGYVILSICLLGFFIEFCDMLYPDKVDTNIISLVIFTLQLIILISLYIKKINNKYNSFEVLETTVWINSDGVEIKDENEYKKVMWDSIKSIQIYKECFLINHSMSTIYTNIFFFDGFEDSRESIINEIKKYKAVKGA